MTKIMIIMVIMKMLSMIEKMMMVMVMFNHRSNYHDVMVFPFFVF